MIWHPDVETTQTIKEQAQILLVRLKSALGISEIIPGCEVIDMDPDAVGTIPRYITVAVSEYHVDVLWRGYPALAVADDVIVVHFNVGDLYEVLGIGGTGASEFLLELLSDYARGHIIRGGATAWEAYDSSPDGNVLVGDGTDIHSVPMHGDATIASDGEVTILLGPPRFIKSDVLFNLTFDHWFFEDANNQNVLLSSRLDRAILPGGATYDNRASIHFEPSLWPFRRGIVLEDEAENALSNPAMYDGNADGIADSWAFNVAGLAGAINNAIEHHERKSHGWVQQFDYTGVPGDAAASMTFWDATAAATFAPTEDCTFSIDVRGLVVGCTLSLVIEARNNVGALLGSSSDVKTVLDTWDRYSVTYPNLPAATDHVYCLVQVSAIDNGDTLDIWVREAQCEKLDTPTTWIMGGLGDGYFWSTVPHNSLSVRFASYIDLSSWVSNLEARAIQSHRAVIQAPYDATGTWAHPQFNFVWDFRGASDADRVYLMYDSVDDRFEVFINGAIRLTSPAQTFTAGEWLDMIVTLDFTADLYQLYINEVLADSDTTALAAPTGLTDWTVGEDVLTSGYVGGWTFAEYTIYSIELDEYDHVKPLYLTGPTIDPGSHLQGRLVPTSPFGDISIFGADDTGGAGAFTEIGGASQFRFLWDGAWHTGDYQLQVSGSQTGTRTEFKLQYYDTALAAWYDVPGSLVQIVGGAVDRVLSDICCVPQPQFEYRVVYQQVGGGAGTWYRISLLRTNGGDLAL